MPVGAFLMENNEVKILFSKVFKNIGLWASQSYTRALFVLLILTIFGIPLIGYLQKLVNEFPYAKTANSIVGFFQTNFKSIDYLLTGLFLLYGFSIYYIYRQFVNSKVIKEDFGAGLNNWAIPMDSSWTTQKCGDTLGKMLSVTNSAYPGTLKGAYGWYDYEISFWAKIDKDTHKDRQNFSLAIRSESNFNGIMLQITKSHIRPHFLYNGTFIVDNENTQQLPTILKPNEWIKVKVFVQGNNVDIFIDDYKVQYKIPTKVFDVENKVMSKGTISLEEIEESHNQIKAKHNQVLDILAMPESPARDEAIKTIEPIMNSIPPFTRVIFEYQKGSIGFRESGSECAHFRDLRVKKI